MAVEPVVSGGMVSTVPAPPATDAEPRVPIPVGRDAGRRPSGPGRSTSLTPWLYLTPVLVALAIWVYGPMLFTAVLSVLDWNLTTPQKSFVGFENYLRLVREPEFGRSVLNTLLYVGAIIPFATAVPMALAITLWKRPGRSSDIYRALLFLPVVLAPVATAISWQFVLNPLGGVANEVMSALGLPERDWLGDPDTALFVIVLITASKIVALNMLLFEAALTALDRRCIEAARIDGAREWEITRYLLVPQLVRTAVLLSLLCVVLVNHWVFTNVAVLTQGGPDDSTDYVYYRFYTYAFTFFDAGTGAAAAITIVAGVALVFAVHSLIDRRSRGNP